jgi:hypothetical protein
MSLAIDVARVVQYHQAQGHKTLRVPQVALGTGLKTSRIWQVYGELREVETVLRHRVLIAQPGGGHRLIEGAITDHELRDIVRWARRRQQVAETVNRRARKALDAASVLALTNGSKHTVTVMQLAANARASEVQVSSAVDAADQALSTL